MEEILDHLWIGDDKDYERVADHKGWSWLRCCKEGPGGHRSVLGYKSLGAPKDHNYLVVRRGNLMALNFIDADDPNFISSDMVAKGLAFLDERLKAGDKVLVACNQGTSRAPSMALMFMRSIGELPDGFRSGFRIFKTLYDKYEPAQGILQHVRSHYNALRKG